MTKVADCVSLVKLHKRCRIISLRQRMKKQSLWLMYIMSQDKTYICVPRRDTRSADKIVFKVPARILPVYEHSPYYQGTKMWNELTSETQKKNNVFAFKKDIKSLFKHYEP